MMFQTVINTQSYIDVKDGFKEAATDLVVAVEDVKKTAVNLLEKAEKLADGKTISKQKHGTYTIDKTASGVGEEFEKAGTAKHVDPKDTDLTGLGELANGKDLDFKVKKTFDAIDGKAKDGADLIDKVDKFKSAVDEVKKDDTIFIMGKGYGNVNAKKAIEKRIKDDKGNEITVEKNGKPIKK